MNIDLKNTKQQKHRIGTVLMSLDVRKPVFDTNRSLQSLKMARGLKFWILVAEGLHYPCGENKGADQLRGYREADLRLCFRICKKPVFLRRGSVTGSKLNVCHARVSVQE